MRKRIATALAVAAAATALTVVPASDPQLAPKAEAGWLCDSTGLCGVVYNRKDSKCWLRVSNGWNGGLAGTIRRIAPGTLDPFKDADGFQAVGGCKTKHSFNGFTYSKWMTGPVKITDGTHATVLTVPR